MENLSKQNECCNKQNVENDEILSNEKIIEIDKEVDKDDAMLPIHFLPEGGQSYDWEKKDLLNDENDKNQKRKTDFHNSIVYKSSKINDGNESFEVTDNLLKAAENGNIEEVKSILLKTPSSINSKDCDGYTALHRSCYSGHLDVVKFLLDKGANIHSKTNDGWQPIHCATRWNHLEICEYLIEKNVNINALTNGSQTPLHLAATSEDNVKILEMLLLNDKTELSFMNGAEDLARDIAARNGRHVKLFELRDESLKI